MAEFQLPSTRTPQELTANENMGRGIEHFAQGLSSVFCSMSRALKDGAPLAFTYHHNSLTAYFPVAVAVLDAELVCSGSIPCPAEMGASIHINKTGSSIIDTVFVCRSTGRLLRRWLADAPEALAQVVRYDVALLKDGGVNVTRGDVRCIIFGHLTRLAIWNLHSKWKKSEPVARRLKTVEDWIVSFGGVADVEASLGDEWSMLPLARCQLAQEEQAAYGKRRQYVSF